MLTYTKGRPYADKENFDTNHGSEGQGAWARQLSEKQKLLASKQQELAHHREIRAQRERKCLQLRQLAEEGSENDDPKEDADDNQSVLDDNNDEGDNSCIVMTKLSGIAKEGFAYSRNKAPKAQPASLDIKRELTSSNDEDSKEPCTTPCLSSEHQLTKHKGTKERNNTGYIMMEVEDTVMVIDESCDNMAHTTKRHWELSKEDILDATVMKAQKIIEHDGRPHTRDYNDVTQEFMLTVIGDYHARLCAESPMLDHAMENALLDAS
ncbi:hypothetical protein EDD17DRAFT_1749722 [Pisolithus thermaeus]|nr:hypothetical protein EV401DRAFT_2083475 [Pisolithus croceorrhizus]KAI6169199.1 hypothetical protein EDD17DRAFT_1749722 [Pisolithus thermaeus]